MLSNGKTLKLLAGGAICCFAAASALAGPPQGSGAVGLLGKTTAMIGSAPSRAPAGHVEFQRLDLRPPEALAGGRGPDEGAFPSARHATLGSSAGLESDAPQGGKWATLRMENKVQELERRVPREGLPVARLWETKTALLHVGLSPRGKPGLWLTQKVP